MSHQTEDRQRESKKTDSCLPGFTGSLRGVGVGGLRPGTELYLPNANATLVCASAPHQFYIFPYNRKQFWILLLSYNLLSWWLDAFMRHTHFHLEVHFGGM